MTLLEYIRLGWRYRQNPFFVKYLVGRKVLDVGVGEGLFVAQDPDRFTGIDIDMYLVEKCQQKGLNVQLMSAFKLDFPNDTFDAVHASQLIEHFTPSDATLFLCEASRVLKPTGIIYLTTPGVRNVWNTFSHIRPYPPMAFKKLLSKNTEGYLRGQSINLVLEGYWGNRFYFSRSFLNYIAGGGDILWPPSNPIGWTIILRKIT